MLALLIELGKTIVTAVVGAVADVFFSRAMSGETRSAPAVSAPVAPVVVMSSEPARESGRDLVDLAAEANLRIATERTIQNERTRAEFSRTAEISNHKLQLQRQLLAEQRTQDVYALPSFGYIRDRLPQDDLPAVLVSDVYWSEASSAWVSPFESIKLFIKKLEDRGICHDATLLPPKLTVPIVSRQQAVEICSHEFPSRPGIIVFHGADKLELNSYLLLWQPSLGGGTAATIHVGRTSHHDHVTAADAAMEHLVETIDGEPGEIPLDRLWSLGAIPLMASGTAERFALLPTLTAIATGIGDFAATLRGRRCTAELAEALRAFYSDEPELANAVSNAFSAASRARVLAPPHWDRARVALRQLAEYGFDSALSIDRGLPTLEVRFQSGRSAILRIDPARAVPLIFLRQANGSSTSFDLSAADWDASDSNYVKLLIALERL